MKLTYRGESYEREVVPMEMIDSGMVGTYRGNAVQFSYVRHIPVPQPARSLSYRGVAYHSTETGAIESAVPVSAVSNAACSIAAMATAQVKAARRSNITETSETDHTHRLTLQRRLQHRMEVAQAKGDQALLRQLQQELLEIV